MNTALVKQDLLNSLKTDSEYRHAWNLANAYTGICFQIRALREQRGWSQSALGKTAKMAQERISILEDPNADTKPTLNTLLRIADAYDVGLDIRFVPYGTVLDRSTKTAMKDLEVPSFQEELPQLEREIATEVERERQRAIYATAIAYSEPAQEFLASSAQTWLDWSSMIAKYQVSRMSVGRELHSAELKTTVQNQQNFGSVINIDEIRASLPQRKVG